MSLDLSQLPIHSLFAPFKEALKRHNQVILTAPTGAGKSTALPMAMLDWPEIRGKIIMLEPRRVATRSIAQYIASQRGCNLGDEVGYRIRGEQRVSRNTRLEIVTEGVLTRMIQQDPELTDVALIIFDEIHERHLTTDLGLALALEVQQSLRDDLKIIAISATLEGLPLASLMPDAVKLASEGRSFPVDISYHPQPSLRNADQQRDAWLSHMGQQIINVLEQSNDGDLLAFLPGQREIQYLQRYLTERLSKTDYLITPLYGALKPEVQDEAIRRCTDGRRKLVLSTNVAESSLTIEGVTCVVDSGYQRQANFNPKTGVTKLSLKRISQASAAQRAGRAGRVQAGRCIRLWGQEEHGRLLQADQPEIVRGDLLSMVFEAVNWGVSKLSELPLLTAAPQANETVAWQLLTDLELINSERKITSLGRSAHQLGCHPRLAHMLLKARESVDRDNPNLAILACILAGVIESRGRSNRGCDISHYLRDACQGMSGQQIKRWMKKLALTGDITKVATHASGDDIATLLAWAFPDRIGQNSGAGSAYNRNFLLANGTGVTLASSEDLSQSEYIIVADFQEVQGASRGRVYLAYKLDRSLLDKELAYLAKEQIETGFDDQKGRFTAKRSIKLGALTLSSQVIPTLDGEMITSALLSVIKRKGLALLSFDKKVKQLQYRLALAAKFDSGESWPDISDENLLNTLDSWLAPYLDGIKTLSQLKSLDCYNLLLNLMNYQQLQRLTTLLPTHWPVATGTNAPIVYDASGRALLRVRLQEALGMAQSPQLVQGKLVVTMELLSPAQRPLALTADLASFWAGPYQEVKKEMKGRYPKHLWPDDPANTKPTRFTKKKTRKQ